MGTQQMERFADMLIARGMSKGVERELLVFGLSCGLELLLNIFTTLILGALFGMAWESLCFLMTYAWVRTYAGGFHCAKGSHCYVMSSGIIVMVLVLAKNLPIAVMPLMGFVLTAIGTVVLWRLAPLATPSKPLDAAERTHYRKKTMDHLGLECVGMILLFSFGYHRLGLLLSLGIFLAGLMVLAEKVRGILTQRV